MKSRAIGGLLLFIVGLLSVIVMVDGETDNAILGFSIWFGGGALMGAGLLLPFKRPIIGAVIGVLFMGTVLGVLMFIFRHGT